MAAKSAAKKRWMADGPEQNLLEEMFKNGTINGSMKPSEAKKKSDVFKGFSDANFAIKFNNTKRMFEDDSEWFLFYFFIFFLKWINNNFSDLLSQFGRQLKFLNNVKCDWCFGYF